MHVARSSGHDPRHNTAPPVLLLLLCMRRYRMDYMQFVDYHRTSGADITIGCIAYDKSRASDFGLMKVCSFACRAGHVQCIKLYQKRRENFFKKIRIDFSKETTFVPYGFLQGGADRLWVQTGLLARRIGRLLGLGNLTCCAVL